MALPFSNFTFSRFALVAAGAITVTATTLALAIPAHAVQSRINLGAASSFAVLAGQGITNSGATTADGTAGADFGSEPNPSFTGIGDVTVTNGTKYSVVVTQVQDAQEDLTAAYLDAASRTPFSTVTDITNDVLTAGVYQSSSTTTLALNGPVTLDAEGNPDAVFIFQAGRDLVTSVGSVVELVNEAQACNVFWQVTSSATIGGSSDFAGHVLALTSITVGTDAEIKGSLLARNGTVTLLRNVFHNDECADSDSGGGGDSGGGSDEGLASTGASDWVSPLAIVLASGLIVTAVFVIRRRRIGRHSA